MKIAVLVSGGVDSSVALYILKNAGHDVTAFYLKIWLEDELSYLGECPWQEDLRYVEKVCEQLKVPLEIISMQQEYWNEVVAHTISEITAGHTPNPDILCNQRIKFGLFLTKISSHFDKIASGHYAQVREHDGIISLIESPDAIKDQTYFLSHLNQNQLQRVLFPIGHLTKSQVRVLAHEYNIPNKDRKDSQGICFLGKFKFTDFVKHHLGVQHGDIIEIETGTRVGTHDGFWFFTIGQRQGIRLSGGPWYVVAKDTKNNNIFISRNYYGADKKRDNFTVSSFHWIAGTITVNTVSVKLRHGAHKNSGVLKYKENGKMHITLLQRDQGIAPGQYAVLYDKTVCLGCGVIDEK